MKMTSLLACVAATGFTSCAVAAPAPRLAPKTFCAPDTNGVDLIEMFVRLPDDCFRYFGSAANNRTRLLDGQGVIVDKAKSYIEIPYANRSNHPDRDKVYLWQMTAFRDKNKKPVLVVNNVINSQTKVKPFLHVFRFGKTGYPYRTTAQDFPYALDSEMIQGKRIYYTYLLPRAGNVITSALPQSDGFGYSYRWTGSRFVRFTPKYEEEGSG